MIKWILGEDLNLIALDSNQKLLDVVKKNHSNVETVRGNAYSMPFESNSFDLICLSNSLHHFKEPEKVVSEMKRLLRNNGSILIQEMVCDEDQTNAQKSHIDIHHFCAEIDTLSGDYHHKTWSRSRLKEFIQSQIGKVIQSEYSYPMKDTHEIKMIERYIKAIDLYLNKITNASNLEEISQKADKLKAKLKKDGFAPAVEMLFLNA